MTTEEIDQIKAEAMTLDILGTTWVAAYDYAEARAENERLRGDMALAIKVVEECRDEIDQYIRNEYPHDHPVQERYRKRDFAANPARVFLDARAQTEGEKQ